MAITMGHLASTPNPVPFIIFQVPLLTGAPGQDDQGSKPPRLTPNETGRLLHINGLLEIERLIHIIKEDGRLKRSEGENKDLIENPLAGD